MLLYFFICLLCVWIFIIYVLLTLKQIYWLMFFEMPLSFNCIVCKCFVKLVRKSHKLSIVLCFCFTIFHLCSIESENKSRVIRSYFIDFDFSVHLSCLLCVCVVVECFLKCFVPSTAVTNCQQYYDHYFAINLKL